MSEELKPCPFCGSDKIEDQNNSDWPGMVWCTNCGYGMSYDESDPKLVKRDWNTRPIEDALRAENQRLRVELEKIVAIDHDYYGYAYYRPNYLWRKIIEIARAALAGEEAHA